MSPAPGFYPDPSADFAPVGDLPAITSDLDKLAKKLGVVIYGISGYRSSAHSVEVGGSANDPHTKAEAADIGVNSQLRSSAGVLTEAELQSVGLTRPFGGPGEINHIQLLHPGQATDPFDQALQIPGKVAQAAQGGTAGVAVGAGEAAYGLLKGPVDAAATATAKAVVNLLWGAIGAEALRVLLYLLFVLGGLALVFTGTRRLANQEAAPA